MLEGETWSDLGNVYRRMADYRESLKAFAAARAVWEKMNNRVGLADTANNRAETWLQLGETGRAAGDFRRALEIARADGLKSAETRALRGLGLASLAARHLGAARRYFGAARDLARATGEIAAESYALRALADADYRQGRLADARRNDESALSLVRQAGDRDGEAATLAQLARDVAAGGNPGRGAREYRRGARHHRNAARPDQRSESADQLFFIEPRLSRRRDRHPHASRCTLSRRRLRSRRAGRRRTGTRPHVAGHAGRALARPISKPPTGTRASWSARPRNASPRRRCALAARVPARAPSNAVALSNALDTASRDLDVARGRVRGANPRYADLTRPATLDVGELQRTLAADDAAVVEYWLGSRQSYVWMVTSKSFRVIRLASRERIEKLSARLVTLLRSPAVGTDGQGFEDLAAAESRHLQAVDRMAAELAAVLFKDELLGGLPRKVGIVTDGGLQDLPFGVLPAWPRRERAGTDYDISYLPSLATLKWLRRPALDESRPAALAVFAAPQLESSRRSASDPALPSLPYARAEAEAITAFLPKSRVWLMVGADAARDRALSADWRRYTIVHFAAHAIVDQRRPELSGIVLSQYDAAGRAEDGMLRMNDIYNLDMPVDLVVLSGCDTAAGRVVDSEGVLSLSRAFFYAGARRVIATLWPVEDRATAEFMREFYKGLLIEHMQAATALRFAQQHLAHDNRWASPYYWAAFVLQGDWS